MAASLLILHDVNGTAARIVSDMLKQIMQGDFAICYLGNLTGIMVRVLSLFLAYAEAILVVEVARCNDKRFNPFMRHQKDLETSLSIMFSAALCYATGQTP
jgi:hypothetical protein